MEEWAEMGHVRETGRGREEEEKEPDAAARRPKGTKRASNKNIWII